MIDLHELSDTRLEDSRRLWKFLKATLMDDKNNKSGKRMRLTNVTGNLAHALGPSKRTQMTLKASMMVGKATMSVMKTREVSR